MYVVINMIKSLKLTVQCNVTERNCHGNGNNEAIVIMKTEGPHHTTPSPPPGHRSIQNSGRPAASKPNPPSRSSHYSPRLSGGFFRSETAANFYSVLAWPWRRADGGLNCACLRNGLILGGNAGRELTTVRWLVEFLTGYSENLLASSD